MEFLNKLIDGYRDDMVKDLQTLIRINSVKQEAVGDMPFGEGVQQTLEAALKIADRMGFATRNIDNYAGEAVVGAGEESIGVIGHLDVVPEGNGWTYPPYAAEVHDGVIYGRGVCDNKGPSIMGLYAIKALVEAGVPLNKQVRMIFGTNEESGMIGIRYYADKVGAPTMSIVPDAGFPGIHGEKGITSFKITTEAADHVLKPGTIILAGQAGNAVNSVPDYCDIEIQTDDSIGLLSALESFENSDVSQLTWEESDAGHFTIRTTGVSAHGSRPETGHNATSEMFAILCNFVPEATTALAEFIHVYNSKIAFRHHGEDIGCGFEDEESGKLAFNPGTMKVTEAGIEVGINIRYPVTKEGEEIFSGIEQALEGTAVVLERGRVSPGWYYPQDLPLIKTLLSVYQEMTGDTESPLRVIGGGTYGRVLPNAIPFGAGFPDRAGNAHKPDENLAIDDMVLATKIYAEAIRRLAE